VWKVWDTTTTIHVVVVVDMVGGCKEVTSWLMGCDKYYIIHVRGGKSGRRDDRGGWG
jgi:hypothetical protein